jgi:hypothetical protein
MILPGLYAILSPLAVGFLIGPQCLTGLLAGAIASGMMLAIMMANAGGAWDNSKKYIEIEGACGGKVSQIVVSRGHSHSFHSLVLPLIGNRNSQGLHCWRHCWRSFQGHVWPCTQHPYQAHEHHLVDHCSIARRKRYLGSLVLWTHSNRHHGVWNLLCLLFLLARS